MTSLRPFVVLLLLVAAACSSDSVAPDVSAERPSPPGSTAGPSNARDGSDTGADFTVTKFEGGTFRMRDHRGTPVVLNFWESW